MFEQKTSNEVIASLNSDAEKGLSSIEAKARLEKYGPNKLQEKKKKSWIKYSLNK